MGQHLETAARRAGVRPSVVQAWIDAADTPQCPMDIAEFVLQVQRAEASAEAQLVEEWRAATDRDWRAAEALLKRRFSERWGDKPRETVVRLEGAAHVEHEVTVDRTGLKEIVERLAVAGVLPTGSSGVIDTEEVEDGSYEGDADYESDESDESDEEDGDIADGQEESADDGVSAKELANEFFRRS